MRTYTDQTECPILFASTYECGKLLSDKEHSHLDSAQKTVAGYAQQCEKVQVCLEKVIESYIKQNKSIIVEGVHLNPAFVDRLNCLYP